MLTSVFAIVGLLALRIGLPILGLLILSEILHYVETRWNKDERIA